MYKVILVNHRDWSECAETSNERARHVQISTVSCQGSRIRRTDQAFERSGESRKFRKLQDHHASLADNEQELAENFDSAVNVAEQDRSRGAALAAEEERVLRCLGAAIIMQWNALPKTLQREIFDTAGSVGKLLETAALRGQIARFLHKHKNDADRNRALDARQDARSGAAALSRWDNEGGAVREGLPK
jgi:hypothetical protein